MKMNPNKDEVVNFGNTNKGRICTMNGRILRNNEEQRNLSLFKSKDL